VAPLQQLINISCPLCTQQETHSSGVRQANAKVNRYTAFTYFLLTYNNLHTFNDSERQWHQLGHMQVCTLLQTDNHASTPPLSFLQATCPSCRPTNSIKALKALLTTTAFTKPVFSLSLTAIRATHTLTAGAR